MSNFTWVTDVPQTGWTVGYETIELSHLTVEYVKIPFSATKAGSSYNPSGDTVQFAFMPQATQFPTNSDWVSGSWEAANNIIYPYFARCLVGTAGTTSLTFGTYVMYLKVTDAPEVPVRVVGQLTIS